MRTRSVPGFRRRSRTGLLVASGIGFLLLALLFAPVELPDRVASVGRVLPVQEWILMRTESGAVTATLRNHRTGEVRTTFAAEPARGDAVQFELGPAASQETVEAGDVVGMLASGESALRLSEVRGQIEQAQAELRLSGAGRKEEVVETARQEVRRAEAEVTRMEAEVDEAEAARAQAETVAARQRELFAADVTSQAALDEAESTLRVAEAAVETAQARAQAARVRVQAAESRVRAEQAGERPEEADVVRARIRALEREGESLARREQMSTLVAPISGRVHRVFSPDTLLLVADVSQYHVLLPVRWADRNRVQVGTRVILDAGPREGTLARIVDVREAAVPQAGQAYLVATAEVTQGADHLVPGLLVPAAIEAQSKTPLDHVRSALGDLFRW
ncbi:MAG: hypothetical protein AAF170_03845 [Bacteroidota bacterium]